MIANEAGRDSGTILFELTGTAAFAVAFSTILGIVAGSFRPGARRDSTRSKR